tara:strand:- start:218 stop:400 length:183 start_codon:yes stop_codon:yes gene_type:complete
MKVGDLVFDASLGQQGIIVETKKWTQYHEEDPEFEHTILYEDGELDHAYENELEVINENR